MGWVKRGSRYFYYKSSRVDGRRVNRYVGGGPAARLAADLDRLGRLERRATRGVWLHQAERADVASGPARELEAFCTLLARAVLVVAGYHEHRGRGWRKRRERHDRIQTA